MGEYGNGNFGRLRVLVVWNKATGVQGGYMIWW